ncbi:hypothetical protein QBC33DRAFT_569922 [Phialemonium atrogriseum]|uniref:Methyltransferase domain-containing protein n=1 Tax=Phialemonium atrogriseum TaxID=1093897 RepID=A0AAJ0C4M8_9PEZI|nr:uncharacterized protein QBC33DRAFT_569922 [Phialemonium atrogriseum]KAK1767601.1 hypothetical protein QBC33DRAFT_569922 [Phialemonium atrogriseum]
MTANDNSDQEGLWKANTFLEELPDDIRPFRDLLETYSKIPPDEVDNHLYKIRDKAWDIAHYPCIGRWSFTNLKLLQGPTFQAVIARLKAPDSQDALLDVACCVGQVSRKLAADGVDPARLYSTDLVPAFIDIGFELFRDRDRFPPGAFVAADLLKPDDAGAAALDGKVTLVHASNFFHLFPWEQQVQAAVRMVRFLKAGTTDAAIFGAQIGCPQPGEIKALMGAGTRFAHDPESLQKMWDEVGERTGTKWRVEAGWVGELPFQIPGFPEEIRYLKFAVYQA